MTADGIALSNDEIEIACDLLWAIKRDGELPTAAEALWERLQPIRHGDSGGTAEARLSSTEAQTLIDTAQVVERDVPLDDVEGALMRRLRPLVD